MAQKWAHVEVNERTLQAGPGRLGGLILSHAYTMAEAVSVYDGVSSASGTLLAKLYCQPGCGPVVVYFIPEMQFTRGLVIVPGFCQVQVLFGG